jgi:trehalose/maltose hydrolase-like predicted phosphorylase
VPDEVGGGIQRQGSINLPGWTQLDVVVAGRRYASADASNYRQVLDLRQGVVMRAVGEEPVAVAGDEAPASFTRS